MPKILVVDDEKNIVLVLRICLQKAGYKVLIAKDGLSAVEQARDEKPDLILLDVLLPKMNGFLVYEALLEDQQTAKIPVVFISAKAEEKDIEKGKSMGARDYLVKPIKQEVLLETLENILKGGDTKDD